MKNKKEEQEFKIPYTYYEEGNAFVKAKTLKEAKKKVNEGGESDMDIIYTEWKAID